MKPLNLHCPVEAELLFPDDDDLWDLLVKTWRLSDYRNIHLSIGKLNVDVIVRGLDSLPPPDTPIFVDDIQLMPGGSATNYSVAIAKFGHSVKLLSRVGSGHAVRGVMATLAEMGVGLDYVMEDQSPQSPTLVFLRNDGSITIVRRKNSTPSITRDDVNRFVGLFDVVHFASVPPSMVVRDPYSKITSYDPGPSAKDVKEPINVDVLFLNERESKMVNMDLVKSRYTVIKKGKEGATVISEVEECSVEALKLNPVDTTGAGDVFDAAFNFGLAEDWGIEEILQFASVSSGLKVTRLGGTSSPTYEEVMSFLKQSTPKVKCK